MPPFKLSIAALALLTVSAEARHNANYNYSAPRDSHGRILRSEAAKGSFKHANPCPANGKASGPCPGYVIDHVIPLKRGGPDVPGNMQWQTIKDAKAKDRIE